MNSRLFIKIVGAIAVTALSIAWISWGIWDLTYAGDPKQIAHINDKVAEYALILNGGQIPEINTWYFSKAHHYISKFTILDTTTGTPIDYQCSWPAKQMTVDLEKICAVQIIEVTN